MTWQVSPRNKIGILAADQMGCTCVGVVSATVAPEADIRERFPIQRPAGDRLDVTGDEPPPLPEAGVANHFGRSVRPGATDSSPQMITVNEQSSGLRCPGGGQLPQRTESRDPPPVWRVVHHGRARLQSQA